MISMKVSETLEIFASKFASSTQRPHPLPPPAPLPLSIFRLRQKKQKISSNIQDLFSLYIQDFLRTRKCRWRSSFPSWAHTQVHTSPATPSLFSIPCPSHCECLNDFYFFLSFPASFSLFPFPNLLSLSNFFSFVLYIHSLLFSISSKIQSSSSIYLLCKIFIFLSRSLLTLNPSSLILHHSFLIVSIRSLIFIFGYISHPLRWRECANSSQSP